MTWWPARPTHSCSSSITVSTSWPRRPRCHAAFTRCPALQVLDPAGRRCTCKGSSFSGAAARGPPWVLPLAAVQPRRAGHDPFPPRRPRRRSPVPPGGAECAGGDGDVSAVGWLAAGHRAGRGTGTSLLARRTPRLPRERLPVRAGGAADVPARQQTVPQPSPGATRYSPPGESLFRHLAIFAGGWTVEAAAAVCELPTRSR